MGHDDLDLPRLDRDPVPRRRPGRPRPTRPRRPSTTTPSPATAAAGPVSGRTAAVVALLAGTAVLYLWSLSASGYGNSFYAAAVQAGSQSWKAFFFGSLDAGNAITVDKPPASLWLMALSVRVFGLSSWSILAPAGAARRRDGRRHVRVGAPDLRAVGVAGRAVRTTSTATAPGSSRARCWP